MNPLAWTIHQDSDTWRVLVFVSGPEVGTRVLYQVPSLSVHWMFGFIELTPVQAMGM